MRLHRDIEKKIVGERLANYRYIFHTANENAFEHLWKVIPPIRSAATLQLFPEPTSVLTFNHWKGVVHCRQNSGVQETFAILQEIIRTIGNVNTTSFVHHAKCYSLVLELATLI